MGKKMMVVMLAVLMAFSLWPGAAGASSKADDIIQSAKNLIGTPYRYGGTTTAGFDCSGYLGYVFSENGIELPRTTGGQFQAGKPVSRSNLKKGDLVFFNTSGRGVSHSGIYIGGNQFIHASTSRGVIITDLNDPHYWGSRYIGARRVIEERPQAEVKAVKSVEFSRGDMADILASTMNLTAGDLSTFSDVKDETDERRKAIEAVSEAGIIRGFEGNEFKPEGAVTRAQVASIFVRAFELNGLSSERVPFDDVSDSHWARSDIQTLVSHGVISGYPDGTYKPERHVSEKEFMLILDRILIKN